MAISSSKYVGALGSAETQQVGLVAFDHAGLVITGAEMPTTTEDASLLKKKQDYNDYKIISLNVAEASALFGGNSPECHFATGYFSYVAPNGLFPQILYFKKFNSATLAKEAETCFGQATDFGSFTFLSIPDESTVDDLDALEQVVSFNSANETRKMFVVNYKKTDNQELDVAALGEIVNKFGNSRGCCLVYGATDWSAFMPMAILAAQNIVTSGVLQFMFNRFGKPTEDDVPTVTDDQMYNDLTEINVNFLGRTQVNGQQLDFFQRGYATNGEDLTLQIAINWIEQQTRGAIMNLFISRVMPATQSSVTAVEGVLGTVMRSARDVGIVAPISDITDTAHKEIVEEIVNDMGGSLDTVTQIETDLTINGFGYYVKLNGLKNLASISGGKSEPSISYKVLYSYAGAIRFISGEYKVVQ